MAIEKDKVIARYKELFGSIALPKSRLDVITAKLALNLPDDATDEDIDARLNLQNEIFPFSEIKKHEDRLLNEKKNPNQKPKQESSNPKEESNEDKDDTNTLLKSLLAKVEGLENAKKFETISEKFKKDERLKGIPDFAFKGRIPQNEDDYESAVEELATDFKSFAEKAKLADYGKDTPPAGSKTDSSKVEKISKEDAAKIVSGMTA